MRAWWPALLVALVVLAVTAGAAYARHHGEPSVDHIVRADGTGLLIANPGGHRVVWERCAPAGGSACVPHGDDDGDQILTVGDEAPGTAFTATQDGVTVRSETWRGRVRATAPPGVEGDVRVGGLVRPLAATWEGGWGREADWLQLQACRTPEGTDCLVIVDSHKFGQCRPNGGRLLPARYEGHWLRVTDARIDQSQPFTAEGYTAPEGIRPHVPGPPGIAGAVAGQIAPGPAPAEDCGQADGLPAPASPEPACARALPPKRARLPSSTQATAGLSRWGPGLVALLEHVLAAERAGVILALPTRPPTASSPACVSQLRVSGVVLTATRLSLRVSSSATLAVRIARRALRPHAAKRRRTRTLTLRAEAAGPAARKLRQLPPGRYQINIRSSTSNSTGLKRTLRRTVKR